MHSVRFLGCGPPNDLIPLSLSRLDSRDERAVASWVWFQDTWQQYSGGREMYVAYYDHRDHPESWAYLFQFLNGQRGICQVREINEALAALNCEIDRSGDAAD